MANDGALKLTGKKGPAYSGGSKASYTPNSNINELAYGKDGGKANAQAGGVPEVVVGGACEVAALPAMPGTLKIGEDKNVSTPVSG